MDSNTVNVLVAGIPGDGLPSTYSLPVPSTTTVCELWNEIYERLPHIRSRLILTTLGNKQLSQRAATCVADLLSTPQDDFVSLRLSVPVLGGKGGFGSQLRAAGGRMSSKRKKNQEEDNSSSRNLDGRRLRTVTEAKSLAEYLAIKPEMDRKEKERRRKRWEDIVETAEKREDEIKRGGKGRLDGKWVEDKEEANERTRAAVLSAMKYGHFSGVSQLGTSAGSQTSGSSGSESDNSKDVDRKADGGCSGSDSEVSAPGPTSVATRSKPATATIKNKGKAAMFFAFDEEDDEFMSSDDDNGDD
ncbi:hypothetical protein SEPCBS119000_005485 [Sporothrix epigloea]|uniref:Sde2 N-terminal ubiquitin domain-containing protein n=1 Tax=Sporothrix epigloea TaxID=1892477 RepID=A0ABP0DXV0_9PEZI